MAVVMNVYQFVSVWVWADRYRSYCTLHFYSVLKSYQVKNR